MAELNENIQRSITQYVDCFTKRSNMEDSDYNRFSDLLSIGFDIVLSAPAGEDDEFYISLACETIRLESRDSYELYL